MKTGTLCLCFFILSLAALAAAAVLCICLLPPASEKDAVQAAEFSYEPYLHVSPRTDTVPQRSSAPHTAGVSAPDGTDASPGTDAAGTARGASASAADTAVPDVSSAGEVTSAARSSAAETSVPATPLTVAPFVLRLSGDELCVISPDGENVYSRPCPRDRLGPGDVRSLEKGLEFGTRDEAVGVLWELLS